MSAPEVATPSPHVAVDDGASGVAIAYAAERLELVLDRPYPPGRPLRFALTSPDATLSLEGKAQGSKRRDDGRFDVRVKLTSLRREHREALEGALGPRR